MFYVLVVVGYMFLCGVFGKASYRHLENTCTKEYCYDHELSSFFIGLFWPIAIPVVLGTVTKMPRLDHTSRDERRRTKELAEAEHQLELARLKAQESVLIDQQLRSL